MVRWTSLKAYRSVFGPRDCGDTVIDAPHCAVSSAANVLEATGWFQRVVGRGKATVLEGAALIPLRIWTMKPANVSFQ